MAHVSLDSIKARLLTPGYLEKDVNQIRLHREVRTSKPMSDRGQSCIFISNAPFPLTHNGCSVEAS
jgi:hypothetical protein